MADVNADGVYIEGSVRWNGEVILRIYHSRTLRNGRYVEEIIRVPVDVDQISCARTTLRHLGEQALDIKRKLLEREEQSLGES